MTTTVPRVRDHDANREAVARWRAVQAAAQAGVLSPPATAFVLSQEGP